MSAAIEHHDEDTLAVGDAVFVHPNEGTQDHLRGIHGVVIGLDGVAAQLRRHPSDEVIRVAIGLLRRDRRRARVPARWEMAS